MLLICDYCGIVSSTIYKIPSSAFYIEAAALVVMKDYINICDHCLIYQKEKEQET